MSSVFVASQNSLTREWVPVAKLEQINHAFVLSYTQGARRVSGFNGLGRMTDLDKTYSSPELFPFFANRLLSKSRPEYGNYRRWLKLDEEQLDDPIRVLAITGGLRATDSLEIIPAPVAEGADMTLDFFSRGMRHLVIPSGQLELLKEGAQLFSMLDVQNDFDNCAVMLRSDQPKALMGYVPGYFCKRISDEIFRTPHRVRFEVRRVNLDAPLDMRLLVRMKIAEAAAETIFESQGDFEPWVNGTQTADYEKALQEFSKLIEK